jgi:hypothetical protein
MGKEYKYYIAGLGEKIKGASQEGTFNDSAYEEGMKVKDI